MFAVTPFLGPRRGGCSASTVLSVPVAPAATAESAGATLRDVSLTISVIGTGYLGVVHARLHGRSGPHRHRHRHRRSQGRVLVPGVAPMFEPGLDELLAKVLPTGRLRFTTDYAQARDADVHFICVGTPQREGENAADTSYVFAAAQSLAPHLSEEALVVGKSTVPVGTAAQLRDRLQTGCAQGRARAPRLEP
jgi:UDPglucose 6-dehydrogenase